MWTNNQTELTDDQAVQEMRLGHSIGFEVVYKRHKSSLRKDIRWLLWRRKNSLDQQNVIPGLELGEWANEISNQTFFKFFQTVESFKGECSVYTWLRKIAHNEAFNRMREELRQRGYELSHELMEHELTEDEIFSPQVHKNIEEDLHYEQLMKKLLDQVQRENNADYLNECLTALTTWANEVSIEDIAIKLKRTPGATRVFLTTCRKKLKELLLKKLL